MPIIVACPTCNGSLRIADDLVGRKVRCPACNATFHSDPPAEPAPRPPEPAPGWRDLPLELSLDTPGPTAPAPPPAPGGSPGLKGAVEIQSSPGEAPPAAPPASAGSPPEEPQPRRPLLNDEQDDLRRCPACGKMVFRDARRCSGCGERFDEDSVDAPRRTRRSLRRERDRQRYEPRRDAEPHRGGLVLGLGITSLVLVLVCGLAPISLVLGLVAWVMGHGDLRKIDAGAMEPEGRGNTQAGWICGIIGTVFSGLFLLGCAGFFLLGMYMESQKRQQSTPPRFNTPRRVAPGPGQPGRW
jgi:predicted Zn finger-like uncharacterized protein